MAPRSGIRNYRFSFNFYITPAVQWLVVANVAVFMLEILLRVFSGVSAYNRFVLLFGLVPSAAIQGLRVWQPFTYLFLHDASNIFHILTNMFVLWMFGRELEIVWGRNRFLRYYFLTGVGAGLINLFVKAIPVLWGRPLSDMDVPTIGASGAIFGVLLACAILFPDRQVIMFPIPVKMRMRTFVIIMTVLEFLGTFGVGGDNISHLCHFGGMLVGYVYLRRGSFLYSVRNTVSDWQLRRNRKRFDVYINKHKGDPPSRPDRWVN
ncbi:MAG TPA: rhomboid family intramembrane serine protease [Candidatus Dormibacteraeota bacterium]|nr:rhomboid family intramembrane serine protease [Candidatus Dormibacteraeota bacterium]